jgi:hypothetical protein
VTHEDFDKMSYGSLQSINMPKGQVTQKMKPSPTVLILAQAAGDRKDSCSSMEEESEKEDNEV